MTRAFPEREDCDRVPGNEKLPLDTHPMMPANDSGDPGSAGPDNIPSASPPIAEADPDSAPPPAVTSLGELDPCPNEIYVRNQSEVIEIPPYACMEAVELVEETERWWVRKPTSNCTRDNGNVLVNDETEIPVLEYDEEDVVISGDATICDRGWPKLVLVESVDLVPGAVIGPTSDNFHMNTEGAGYIALRKETETEEGEIWLVDLEDIGSIPFLYRAVTDPIMSGNTLTITAHRVNSDGSLYGPPEVFVVVPTQPLE